MIWQYNVPRGLLITSARLAITWEHAGTRVTFTGRGKRPPTEEDFAAACAGTLCGLNEEGAAVWRRGLTKQPEWVAREEAMG